MRGLGTALIAIAGVFGALAWLWPTQVAHGPMLLPHNHTTPITNLTLPDALKDVETIALFGDSITQLGGEPGGYVWVLEQSLRRLYPQKVWNIVNAGVSGDTSADLRDRLKSVLAQNPDLLIINVGVNDVWHQFFDFKANRAIPAGDFPAGVTLADYQTNLDAIITTAQAQGIQVVLMSPTPIRETEGSENQRLQGYITIMQTLAQTYDCEFVNLYQPFMGAIATYQNVAGPAQRLLTYDGVHANPAGNQLIAQSLLTALGVPMAALNTLQLQPCVGMCNVNGAASIPN